MLARWRVLALSVRGRTGRLHAGMPVTYAIGHACLRCTQAGMPEEQGGMAWHVCHAAKASLDLNQRVPSDLNHTPCNLNHTPYNLNHTPYKLRAVQEGWRQ